MFKTTISLMRPVEVIYDRDTLNEGLLKFLKASSIPPQLISYSSNKDNLTVFKGLSLASKNFGSDFEKWPKVLC